ncbi:MAG: tRNA s(4)U8 sulfurtransferase [Candidatus Aramenus sulfurataquae]|uniref:Probable tRNA sulfurtransferase n=2 Tax=Candidatus Aramenus sulfurataquae TaxID=1326980 RepID=W7KVB8_9CREN|nr:MAG: tRNA s(4)U8 sulfurtransferase [Candidatus Aramenus sulfurataquae]
MKVLIVRYSEVGIKGDFTRRKMERLLINNLLASAKRKGCGKVGVVHGEGRIFLYGDVDCLAKSSTMVFGVKSVSPAEELEFTSLDQIAEKAEELWKEEVKGRSFAVRVRRLGQHPFSSIDVADAIGSRLVKYGRVNLDSPEVEVHVEVRKDKAYFYDQVLEGPGGLPLGSEGRVLALFSGGIDSPVASWMVMKRGVYVDFLYCNLGSEVTKNAVLDVARKLIEWSVGYTPKFFLAECGKITKGIMTGLDKRLWPIAFKRALYLLADKLATSKGYGGIVTGESLGQVSTQNLSALKVLNRGISLPILRPLLGFDKDEIVKMARHIGTYEYSSKIPEFCSVFSFHPKTKFTYRVIEEVDKVVSSAVDEVLGAVREVKLYGEEEEPDLQGLKVDVLPEGAVLVDLTGKAENAVRLTPRQVMEFVFKNGPDKTYVFLTGGDKFNVDLVRSLRKMGVKAFVLS